MPISVQHTWEETHDDITIKIPFRGQSTKNVDVFVADSILKVSYHPHLLDINLAKTVKSTSCKALLKDGNLIIRLEKTSGGLWHKLIFESSKEETKTRRKQSLQRREREIQQQHEKAKSKKLEEERMTVRMQMKLDSAEHQSIEDLKNKEKKDEEDKLYESIADLTKNIKSQPMYSRKSHAPQECKIDPLVHNTISTKNDVDCSSNEEDDDIFHVEPPPIPTYPSVRGARRIRFKHTPRIFKTPVRESAVVREKEFLIKNRPFLRYNKHFNTECTDVSDADPLWLKRKGDDFYIAGDYMSAINAYSEAFEKDKNLIQALTNRSACYLYIGEAQSCILDSEEALDLISNGSTQTNLSPSEIKLLHKKILIRIANAHCQVGGELIHFEKALKNLKVAQDLDVSDDSPLVEDIERVQNIFNAMKTKVKADELLCKRMVDDAIDLYNKVLNMEPSLLSAKINCATAYLIHGRWKECLALCEQVLEVFRCIGPCKHGEVPPIGSIPFPGSLRRRQMVIASLCKKAEVFTKLGQYNKALVDLKRVKMISTSYEKSTDDIDEDIETVQKLCNETKNETMRGSVEQTGKE